MELIKIHFNYDIAQQIFENITYSFSLEELSSLEKETIKNNIQQDFIKLEEIIDNNTSIIKPQKNKTGNMTDASVSFGYDYYFHKYKPFFKDKIFNASLSYDIYLNKDDKIHSIDLSLRTRSKPQDLIINIYDDILSMSDISFSEDAKKTMEKIYNLREENKQAMNMLDYF